MDMDMKNTCRICLNALTNTKTISIYQNYGDDMSIYLKIMEISGIDIPENDENLPGCICTECCNNLNKSFEFINLCRVSDGQLKNNLLLLKKEIITPEEDCKFDLENEFNVSPNCTSPVDSFFSNSEEASKDSSYCKSETDEESSEEKVEIMKYLLNQESTPAYILKNVFQPVSGVKRKHLCRICKKIISGGRYHQKRHLQKANHQSQLPFIKDFEDQDNIEITPIPKKKPVFICEICGRVFDQKYKFRNHELQHFEKKFFCEICKKAFRYKLQVQRHMRVHTGEKPYKCKFCEKCFSHIATRKAHERTHTNERPFKCSVCDKQFRQKVVLTMHMKIHTGEKPYSCNICNLSFIKKYHIDRHYKSKSHHKLLKENK